MSKTTFIDAPDGAKYLSEVLSTFPSNCIFDKGRTGCGGTTLALTDKKPTIIAMPHVNPVASKVSGHPEYFGVYGSRKWLKGNLQEYLSDSDICPKIVCTYDSLPTIIRILETVKGWRLLVDEYHILQTEYGFRKNAIQGVLDSIHHFDDCVFMSATPISIKALSGFDTLSINWGRDNRQINILKSYKPRAEVANIVSEFICGKRAGNAHVFVNNVTFISAVIEKCQLNNDNTRVVCSVNNTANKSKLLGLDISDTTTTPKKINFYTATSFEGCDVFDEDGHIYFVSDGCASQTMVSIQTTYIQLMGRIRDAKDTSLTHIYKPSKLDDISVEEYTDVKNKQLALATRVAELCKDEANEPLIEFFESCKNGHYFKDNGDVDILQFETEIAEYKTRKGDYASVNDLANAIRKAGFNVSVSYGLETEELKSQTKRKSFEEKFKEIVYLYSDDSHDVEDRADKIKQLEDSDPLLRRAYDELGVDKVEKMQYRKWRVKAELVKRDTTRNIAEKCISILDLHVGDNITVEQKRKKLNDLKETLELNTTPKLEDYYTVKKSTKRIHGKHVKSYRIVSVRAIAEHYVE